MYEQLKNMDKLTKRDFSTGKIVNGNGIKFGKTTSRLEDNKDLDTLASLGSFESTTYNDIMYSSGLGVLDIDVDGIYQGYSKDDSDELRSLHSHYFN